MPVDIAEAIEFIKDLVGDRQVRRTVGGALKGAVGVGMAAGAGALLLGPIGFAVGGALGGIGASIATRDEFISLPQAIADMPLEQKQVLARRVELIVHNVRATDIATLGVMLAGDTALRNRIAFELIQYMTQEMQLAIN